MKNIYITLAFFLGLFSTVAQQESQYTNYMLNTNNINPAYVGSKKHLSGTLLSRYQWVGLEGAPVTHMISVITPLKNKHMGGGLSLIHDAIGPTSETMISADYAYGIQINKTNRLVFGLKAGVSFFGLDYTKLNEFDSNDEALRDIKSNVLNPNIGAGMYYYGTKWYLGLSSPFLIESTRKLIGSDQELPSLSKIKRHYYLISGYVFEASKQVKIKPAMLLKVVNGAPISMDISISTLIHNQFSIGCSYRHQSAISVLTSYQVNPRLGFGYSYDIETTELSKTNSGSHEFHLNFRLVAKSKKILTPRFF